jgi:hypothetical protein
MSFGRKVARNAARKSGDWLPLAQPLIRTPKAIPLRDVRKEIMDVKGEIQCPKCHRSSTLVRMTCEEFAVAPELKAAHDKLAEPGHEHVRCTLCSQFIIYTAAEAP